MKTETRSNYLNIIEISYNLTIYYAGKLQPNFDREAFFNNF